MQGDQSNSRHKTEGAGFEQPFAATAAADGPPASAPRARGLRFTYPSGAKPLSGYTLKRGIGVGGFGEVYFALSDAGKEVALKRIQRNVDVELRGVSQCLNLKHGNLITLWDIRQDDHGEGWVVMEYVPGPNLRDLLNDQPQGLSLDEALRWFVSISKGVAYLHDHGIVHRDLKPGNIFLDEDEQVIKIGDYGLSKFISCSQRSGQTESVGTFHYMAPEIGKGAYGREIDIYALGIILHELLTGQVPFDGESSQEIIMKHLMAEPDLQGVRDPFRRVIRQALAKDPTKRFVSAQQMLAALVDESLLPHLQTLWPTGQGFPALRPTPLTAAPPSANVLASDHESASSATNGEPSNATTDSSAVEQTQPKLEPLFIREDLLVIDEQVDEGIYLGEVRLQQRSVEAPPRRDTTVPHPTSATVGLPGSPPNLPSRRVSADTRPGDPDRGGRESHSAAASAASAGGELDDGIEFDEPLARSFGYSLRHLWRRWSDSRLSLPVKVTIVVTLCLAVILNAGWLLPFAAILASAYAIYYVGLCLWRLRRWRHARRATPSEARVSQLRRQKAEAAEEQWRRNLRRKPLAEVVSELIGSLLMSALVIGTLSALVVVALGQQFAATQDALSFYMWLIVVATSFCGWLLIAGKVWERTRGDTLHRRLWMLTAGVILGGFTYLLADYLLVSIPTVQASQRIGLPPSPLIELRGSEPLSQVAAMMLFAAGLLVTLRWWRQTDALRSVRLSLFALGRAILVAAALAWLLTVPLLWAVLVAGIVSFAAQIAAPHVKHDERDLVAAELVHPR